MNQAGSPTASPSSSPLAGPTAAVLLIGEELLSGKVQDENATFLVRELRALGVVTRRIEVVPDELDEIATAVRALAARFDHVFTSGGVGATHDDVTLPAVAAAFGMKLARHPELERLIRAHMPGFAERDLRMADIPDGAHLVRGAGSRPEVWPVVAVRNVFVLPGVPAILRRKFSLLRDDLRADTPIVGRAIFVADSEGQIAGSLDAVVAAYPTVVVGSYPHFEAVDYQVKVTLDARDPSALERALGDLVARLGAAVVRVE
jgi:molybdenum cofactor synthesis domain-containing protein